MLTETSEMKAIKGLNMVSGKFLRKISIVLSASFFGLSCNSSQTIDQTYKSIRSNYFVSANDETVKLILDVSVADLKDISVMDSDLYYIKTINQRRNKSEIVLVRRVPETVVPGITIQFDSHTSQRELLRVFFYSRLISADSLNIRDNVIFNQIKDVVPPLLVVSSLQVAQYSLCSAGNSYEKFSSYKELYYISYLLEPGKYIIAGKDCKDEYFTYTVK